MKTRNMKMRLLNEYRADTWNISRIDPDTSGKYIFDQMEYNPGNCQNCGHPIKWSVHIHDAERPEKRFVVGDDCIEFLLALGGLENIEDLKKFREAKSQLMKLFHWIYTRHIDTQSLQGMVGFVNRSGGGADYDNIEFLTFRRVENGYAETTVTKDGRPLRPCVISAPGFNADNWIHFYPRLKEVILSYDNPEKPLNGFFDFAWNNQEFQKIDSSVYHLIYRATSGMEHGVEKELDTSLGRLRIIRTATNNGWYTKIYIITPDGKNYNRSKVSKIPFMGNVWNSTIEPMFPDCTINTSVFLTSEKNVEACMDFCCDPLTDEDMNLIETAKQEKAERDRKKQEEEERKRQEEEERQREEDRKNAARQESFKSMMDNPTVILNGIGKHCISDNWLQRVATPLQKLIVDKLTASLTNSKNPTSTSIQINNCVSIFKLKFKDQIAQLKRMDDRGRRGYLGNILSKMSAKYNRPLTWKIDNGGVEINYEFQPTDIKDTVDGSEASVMGAVNITIRPIVTESRKKNIMKKISENARITLTLGQLKRLVRESTSDDSDFEIKDGVLVKYHGNKQDVIIPDGVTSIGYFAFYDSKDNLESVIIPNSVKEIRRNAFSECNHLKSITIPESVTSIGNNAFADCSGLLSVNIPDSVTSIGFRAFADCRNLKSITIPNSVTSIEYYVFGGCSNLKSIEIPNSVTRIEKQAFAGCSFDSITIPNSVTSIGDYAFFWCEDLNSVIIPNSVKNIGYKAFYYCHKLRTIVVSNEEQKEMLLNGENEFSYSVEIKTMEQNKQDELVDEMMNAKVDEMAKYAQELLGSKYKVKAKFGKTSIQTKSSHAIVIYGGKMREPIDQIGYILLRYSPEYETWSYELENRFPEKLDINNWKDEIRDIVSNIVGYYI